MTPAATATPALPDAPAYMLPGVNLFASGEYRGRRWTAADVRRMADNARLLGPGGKNLLLPPGAPGHEDDDDWQQFVGGESAGGNPRTDEPAAGWVDPDSVRAVPDPKHPGEMVLKGNVVNVPRAMAEKIAAREYRFGSSEIYDQFKDDFGRCYGKTLRKFSYLGSEVPQVKRLGELPMPVPMPAVRHFAERPGVVVRVRAVRHGSLVHTHAEASVMDRTQLIAAVQAAMPALSQAFLESLADDKLAELAAALPQPAAPAAAPPAAPPAGLMAEGDAEPTREEMIAALVDLGDDAAELEGLSDDELRAEYEDAMEEGGGEEPAPPADAAMADAPAREEMIAELVAAGQDAAALEAMPDEELQALYAELTGAAPAAPPAEPPATPMGDKTMVKYAERVDRRVRKAGRVIDQTIKLAEAHNRKLRKAAAEYKARDCEQFCEQLVRKGIATPAQIQTVYKPLLLGLDDTAPVHAFSDNGVTRKVTAYDRKKAELLKLAPVVRLGERLGGGPAPTGEAEEAKVARFAEVQAPHLAKAGYKTPRQFVEKFSEARKKRPELTAREFIGPEADRY